MCKRLCFNKVQDALHRSGQAKADYQYLYYYWIARGVLPLSADSAKTFWEHNWLRRAAQTRLAKFYYLRVEILTNVSWQIPKDKNKALVGVEHTQ